eukprot:TRINITY_DN19828_c0_g1_i1.p1 TRINITY_DN19828_c0_g1~~TRINITY_DN19828_c0_g1_i1.p1  ORF type:complete len:931 (-),score=271.80 TRINITY_DN19828_c0_g1_i1:37-2829(-)
MKRIASRRGSIHSSVVPYGQTGGYPEDVDAEWDSKDNVSGRLVKAGNLEKRGGKSSMWKNRWISLTDAAILYIFKSSSEKRPRGMIALNQGKFTIQQFREEKRMWCFRLVPEKSADDQIHPSSPSERSERTLFGGRYKPFDESICISTSTEFEMKNWIQVIESALAGQKLGRETVEIEERLSHAGPLYIEASEVEFDASEVIGKGAAGIVRKGVWLGSTEVAIKALNNVPEFTDNQELVQFYKEIVTLSLLRHPSIVTMYGYTKKDGYVYLITEYVPGGNLDDVIHSEKILDLSLKLKLALAVARGMVYLHSIGIIHRDLKPSNLLVENIETAKIKLCDFGLSRVTSEGEDQSGDGNFGTPVYAAPELGAGIMGGIKADVFSFGVILWELYTRQRAWNSTPVYQIHRNVIDGARLPIPSDCPAPLADLMEECWAAHPDDRPRFVDVYKILQRSLPSTSSSTPTLAHADSTLSIIMETIEISETHSEDEIYGSDLRNSPSTDSPTPSSPLVEYFRPDPAGDRARLRRPSTPHTAYERKEVVSPKPEVTEQMKNRIKSATRDSDDAAEFLKLIRSGPGSFATNDQVEIGISEKSKKESKREGINEKKYKNGDYYHGSWTQGKKNGVGTMEYASGNIYEGSWVEDIRSGHGKLTWTDGAVYVGQWSNDVREGSGVMSWRNGESYEGQWKQDRRNGYGKKIYKMGDIYEGEWYKGRRHGRGMMTYNSGSVYDGEWYQDERVGRGKLSWVDGAEYEGHWAHDLREGYGKMTWHDGSTYFGEWKNDRRHGNGIKKFANGNVYRGSWVKGKEEGEGAMTFKTGNFFNGSWKSGYREGYGNMSWIDGSKYEGEWVKDRREGTGRMRSKDGSVYDGQWHRDKRHGSGVQQYASGETYDGEWRNGKREGKGKLVQVNGVVWECMWESGNPVNPAPVAITS